MDEKEVVLFFTRGSSLGIWEASGLFPREVKPYICLSEMGVNVTFVTYGDRNDLSYSSRLPGIRVICNRWSLPQRIYVRLLPALLRSASSGNWIGKSNQCLGAEVGLVVSGKRHKFIARNGYLFSNNEERSHGRESNEFKKAKTLEKHVFTKADRVVVTAEYMKAEIVDRYRIEAEKIYVIPNYVDVNTFAPFQHAAHAKFTVGYVGRLTENKNPLRLLNAVQGIDVSLHVVGGGPLAHQFEEQASKINFAGIVSNDRLPKILNSWDLFVLPSLYEGHPKALLEAMACGLPVIATKVPGNRELIRHGVDGYLCGTSSDEIRKAILTLKEDKVLRKRLGENARKRAVEEFSLDRIVQLEMDLLQELSGTDA